MAILITGHKGFIGQNMMAALPGSVGYEWGDGSVPLDGIDRVIHLGAISSTACNDWHKLREQNVAFSVDLLHACAARKIPFQFASSASVYGPNAKTFRETDAPDPQTPYAESKLFVENLILTQKWPMPVQGLSVTSMSTGRMNTTRISHRRIRASGCKLQRLARLRSLRAVTKFTVILCRLSKS
jgi:nucleoside-diphosphate-sugar epimerase